MTDILIIFFLVFITVLVIKNGFDMCKTRAEIDMIYLMCKFLTKCYLDEYPEEQKYFEKLLQNENRK